MLQIIKAFTPPAITPLLSELHLDFAKGRFLLRKAGKEGCSFYFERRGSILKNVFNFERQILVFKGRFQISKGRFFVERQERRGVHFTLKHGECLKGGDVITVYLIVKHTKRLVTLKILKNLIMNETILILQIQILKLPIKNLTQTSDNIACFYNLIFPIIKSDESFNVILRLET